MAGTKGNIDHIVVAVGGVWVVDTKNYKGKVEMPRSGWRKPETLLFVAGRNRTKLIDNMEWQMAAVDQALTSIGMASAPVRAALCFTNSEWPLFGGMGLIGGVWVVSGGRLVKEINKLSLLTPDQVRTIAAGLRAQLASRGR